MFKVRSIGWIESVNFKKASKPDFERNAPIIDTVSAIQTENSELMFSLFGNESTEIVRNSQTKILMKGHQLSKTDREALLDRGSGKVAVTTTCAKRLSNNWQLAGNVKTTSKSDKEFVYSFRSHFQVSVDGKIKLRQLELREAK
jgi:hypothetical protein